MGGAKTVDPSKYMSKRDPSRDVAIAMMMQQAQAQQMANQAEMLKQYAGVTPQQQTYDAIAQSRRAAELGLQNVLRQRQMERITNPQAEALRLAQSKQLEDLTAKENADRYMGREYMLSEGLPTQYETGLGDSTIGRAAMYDRALQAKKAYEESLALQRQAYLAKTAQPSGGISPETSIAAQQAAEAQNIAAQEAYKQGMFGSIGGFGQSAVDAANQQFANVARMQQAQQQSQQAYNQMLATGAQQAAESKNAMNAAYIGAAGNIASSALGAYGKMGGSGSGGLNKSGFYGGLDEASTAYNVPTSQLSYQSPTGLGGFAGIGKQGGYYYTPAGSYGR
jgi:hypothetical protein